MPWFANSRRRRQSTQSKKWLSIGVTNLKNLAWIPWHRAILFTLLMITAWPLHTIWNSVMFSTRQANVYSILIVSPNFTISEPFDENLANLDVSGGFGMSKGFNFSEFSGNIIQEPSPGGPVTIAPSVLEQAFTSFDPLFNSSTSFLTFAKGLREKANSSTAMQYLNKADCMTEYSQTFLTGRRNLLVIIDTTTPLPAGQASENGSMLAYLDSRTWDVDLTFAPSGVRWNPGAWICSKPNNSAASLTIDFQAKVDLNCDVSKSIQNSNNYDNWTITSQFQYQTYHVDHCLSELVPEECQVQFALPLMSIVLACNVIKLFCMALTIPTFSKAPMTVLGDAIASFLERNEPMTGISCLSYGQTPERVSEHSDSYWQEKTQWSGERRRWAPVARKTWALTIFLSLAALSYAAYLLRKGVISTGTASFRSLSFGEVSVSALLILYGHDGSASSMLASPSIGALIGIVLLVNTPQAIFSTLYFLYNRVYTCMLSMDEWTKFANRRQSLRVSHPIGIQRSTYWLQLPYRYSVPLLVTSSLMHWIISQSLFLVRVSFLDQLGQPIAATPTTLSNDDNILTIPGFSPKAILAGIIVGGVMILVLIGNLIRRYSYTMPLVGNNSWAISTACHKPQDDENAASEKLIWGAIRHPRGHALGQCCFTSHQVQLPIIGEHYDTYSHYGSHSWHD